MTRAFFAGSSPSGETPDDSSNDGSNAPNR